MFAVRKCQKHPFEMITLSLKKKVHFFKPYIQDFKISLHHTHCSKQIQERINPAWNKLLRYCLNNLLFLSDNSLPLYFPYDGINCGTALLPILNSILVPQSYNLTFETEYFFEVFSLFRCTKVTWKCSPPPISLKQQVFVW